MKQNLNLIPRFCLVFCQVFLMALPGIVTGAQPESGALLREDRFPGRAGALAAGNNMFFAAGLANPGVNPEYVVRAYGADNEFVWEDRVPGAAAIAITVAGPVVFAGGHVSDPFNGRQAMLRAYDARTGDLLWEDRSGSSQITDLAEKNGAVYSTTWYGAVRAHMSRTGQELWSSPFNGYVRSLAVDNQTVTVSGVTLRGALNIRTSKAFDAFSGELIWEAPLNEPGGNASSAKSASERGVVVTTGSDPRANFRVRAHDSLTGDLLWEDAQGVLGGQSRSSDVTISGNLVHVAGPLDTIPEYRHFPALGVRTYDFKTGDLIWESRLEDDGEYTSSRGWAIASHGDELFVVGSVYETEQRWNAEYKNDLVIQCYDRLTGRLRWEDRVDGGLKGDDAGYDVAVSGNRVAVAGTFSERSNPEFVVRFYTRTSRPGRPGHVRLLKHRQQD